MTLEEVRTIVAENKDSNDWLESFQITFDYSYLEKGFKQECRGLPDYFQYIDNQSKGWNSIKSENQGLPVEFDSSYKFFDTLKAKVDELIGYLASNKRIDESIGKRLTVNQVQHYQTGQQAVRPFPFDHPTTLFLLAVYKNRHIDSFRAAFNYLKGGGGAINAFVGQLLASNFLLKNEEIFVADSSHEQSISQLRSSYRDYVSEAEQHIQKFITGLNKQHKETMDKALSDHSSAAESFSTWFENAQTINKNFKESSDKDLLSITGDYKIKINELESTYKDKLKLEEPAKYWEVRAKKMRKQAWWVFGVLVFLVLAIAASLMFFLVSPEKLLTIFGEENLKTAIRWSVLYITFLSFMAFCIRALSKVMFSSFHLARDCEERNVLTYFYLSLLKDAAVDEKERYLIIQSLFSRADSGLLKEDSSPTMPADIANRVLTKQ